MYSAAAAINPSNRRSPNISTNLRQPDTALACLAGLYDPSIGLLIPVAIFGVGKLSLSQSQNVPCYGAVVDTGASCTRISKRVIADCGLLSHSKTTMISASGNVEANALFASQVNKNQLTLSRGFRVFVSNALSRRFLRCDFVHRQRLWLLALLLRLGRQA